MLAIARQKALRLASIEGCKLFRQQPACLRLVIIRVRDEMNLDALLRAAHWVIVSIRRGILCWMLVVSTT